jgi:predicted ATP-grasp superfamily ATP-dependent carboligase
VTQSYLQTAEDLAAQHLRRPLGLVGFGGWIDAGMGATGAIQYLIEQLNARRVAELDPEPFFSFTDTRPRAHFSPEGERVPEWPRVEWYVARMPEDVPHDLVLFIAPEPNLRWRTFTAVVVEVFQRLGVEALYSLGAVLAPIHHRARVPLRGWATADDLRQALRRLRIGMSGYEGPTGIATVLLTRALEQGLPGVGITASSPSYVSGVPNPRTSVGLLRAVSELTGVPFPLGELERAGRALEDRVDQFLANQPEVRERVERLLQMQDVLEPPAAEPAGPEPGEPSQPPAGGELPSSEAVLQDLEEFLKQLRQDEGNPGA